MSIFFLRFLLWIKNEVNSCHERAEEERAIYIVSLCDSIRGISQRGAVLSNGHIESVMTLISDLLDANNSHVVLVPLLDTCLTVSELYSHVFMAHFEEIVDFTIGWFVEDSLPSSVSDKCYEVISGLNKFWRQEPEFGKQLMLHFLEDITGFVEDSEKQGTLCESLSKARSILKVLSSILEIFVEFSNLDKAYDYVNIITEKALISCKDNIIRLGSIRSYAVADFFSGYCKILLIPALVYDGKNPDLISQCNSTIICLMCKFKSTQSALTVFIDYFVKVYIYIYKHLIPCVSLQISSRISSSIETELFFRHDYFLPNSEWLLDGSRNSVIKESLSSRFAQIQLLTLIKLLSCHLVWPSSRSLVAEWLHGLISGLSDSVLNTLSNRSEWQQLKSVLRKNILVEDCHDRVRSIAARLRALDARSVQEVSDLTKTAISKIRNCDEVGGMNIWASLDMRIYLR
uniref:Non-specific serine/threonine protein kinase n=1 Tax=Heterorhabditis bacteriophora TaxID=37862 RepID=A0A1I7WZN6_HETBA